MESRIPVPYVGEIVYWYRHADRSNGAMPMLVTQATPDGCCAGHCFNHGSEHMTRLSGIRHIDDPWHRQSPQPDASLRNGGWGLTPLGMMARQNRLSIEVPSGDAERLVDLVTEKKRRERIIATAVSTQPGRQPPATEVSADVERILWLHDGGKTPREIQLKMGVKKWKLAGVQEVLIQYGRLHPEMVKAAAS